MVAHSAGETFDGLQDATGRPADLTDRELFGDPEVLPVKVIWDYTYYWGVLAQFFFLALYMQNFLHFSPLQAGIRFLPATVVIIVMGPIAGRLTERRYCRACLADRAETAS